ncbi:hypothetical protein BC739_001487 [Kutzneria viridogrisea]|uniref:Uncharacterized protein n=1 Tax=Kutzneria viridogrisea TaxID=47990 RepID=A0ABR6BBP0_9PSEU|nr:hypothetical protein [Kutzneria albida]MBA8924290.1 hypothetical protein [Kutzneria viridogrisea]
MSTPPDPDPARAPTATPLAVGLVSLATVLLVALMVINLIRNG